ncbi:outer membrane receptor for ferric coprogen and ferric-rhodotorulic acid|uniref:Outer membrane receptor for ferric coprogen and ferric-rhodotorulic acid n=1 Tax=Brenneria salicis ATCC 15712 = DSM 30166 TaxID=714314 RepID=A0A366HYC9_9GAMM|nr:ferric-rhodotorulic acid/ferric-coprogen receptor FhuE [Brenneria salicis]NMN92611.1 outer membrane receptor for ferric coprogen and ferric-rhodotorulic acid [Brenneria salicis ATCC 15712 = DSM 30166]RBP57532.1 outer membrane receptor for ferric coprogen and ferric-rhodotorulic acid [Brenneria salicis ATCC 15712 = DSM 30166]RLM28671.1 ferric-rhodotorulic acid/ferric-coprogen receptor FhuE [Brenneria salicis ATCC 15712 = DSM 30166]
MSCVTYAGETRMGAASLARIKPFAVSLLTVLVSASLSHTQAFAEDQSPSDAKADTLVVSADANASADVGDAQDYSVKVTRAGTKMSLVPRDIPQSVSIISQQRMQDQNLQTIGEVMANTTGVTAKNIDSERSTYFSRGFLINNYLFDGIPTVVDDIWDFGDAGSDTAIYERIEVVRGATGLMTGTGNPSAAVNMVRKHADSREFTGAVSGSYGSWDQQRMVADLSAPLTESGNVRGRMIAGYQDNDTWLDRYHKRKKFLYGVIDADLTDSTTLSLGYDYQESDVDNPTWGGLPTWFTDGSRTHFDRSFNPAPNWSYSNKTSKKVLADLAQRFDNGWKVRLNGTRAETEFDSKLMYANGFPDKDSGQLVDPYGLGIGAYGGWNKGTRKVDAIDTYASGPFELLGRQHELVVGGGYSKQRVHFYNSQSTISSSDMGNYYHWDGNIPDPGWGAWTDYEHSTTRQKSLYATARFSLADPLHLIAGARYTDWSIIGSTGDTSNNRVTPYVGLVYDINDTWSAYASYTDIFQPQTRKDINNKYLAPTTGKNYEAGIKGDWYNSRLTASVSVFRIELDHLAQSTGQYIAGSTEIAYSAVDGVVSKGVEFEVNGALTDNLQMTFGGSRFVADDKEGKSINPNLPRTSLKLFTRYQLPMLPDLTLGGGVNWQNSIWEEGAGPQGMGTLRAEQGSYALVNLFGRYQMTKQLAVQANINNLFDKTYYNYLAPYAVYGTPRSVSMTVNYTF